MMKKILSLFAAAVCIAHFGCGRETENYADGFIEQNSAVLIDRNSDPLMLVVEIGDGGKLSLNKIETGTIADAEPLCGKLKTIFEDRRRTRITERGIYVYPKAKTARRDLKYLIEKLAQTDASPIFLIGGD